jgi:hypothetical protein
MQVGCKNWFEIGRSWQLMYSLKTNELAACSLKINDETEELWTFFLFGPQMYKSNGAENPGPNPTIMIKTDNTAKNMV